MTAPNTDLSNSAGRAAFHWSTAIFFVAMLFVVVVPVHADLVGQIYACYACQNTGNAAIDAALTANPGVAGDGILFAFVNTSAFAITGGVFSVNNATPNDSFNLPTIAANSTFILIPGITSDSPHTHTSGGLFDVTGVKDTSDGSGGVSDASIFAFTGLDNGLATSSLTAGASTAIPGTFTPGDPGLFHPYRDNPLNGSTSFVGLGPNGDGGCNNCYFGLVATLDTPSTATVPEPTTVGFLGWCLALVAAAVFTKRKSLPGRNPSGE
jgi:hypothetical protein